MDENSALSRKFVAKNFKAGGSGYCFPHTNAKLRDVFKTRQWPEAHGPLCILHDGSYASELLAVLSHQHYFFSLFPSTQVIMDAQP